MCSSDLDLSALCPGYASDCLGEQFEAWGVHDYLVEVGGEFRARGDGALGSGWRVGVERPTSRASDLQSPSAASGHAKDGDSKSPALALAAAVSLANQSLATSGDYRNFFVVNGRRFSHHLDPRTGWPTESAIASVSVIHTNTMHADALGTGLTVLGFERAWALAEREQLGAIFILRHEGKLTVHSTSHWPQNAKGISHEKAQKAQR